MRRRKTAIAEANGEHVEGDVTTTTETESPPVAIPVEGNGQSGPPEPVNGTRPVETFSVPCGGGAYIQASIWGKQIEYDGRMITVYSVTIRKGYKDATTGEWKNTNSFRGSELYCVQHVISRASEWVLNARTTTSSDLPF